MTESKRYSYFDTPEGEDIFKKWLYVLKPVGLTAIALSTVDIMCLPKNRTYLQVIGRYAYLTLPVVGMVTAFVVTSNLAVNIRKKNDYKNWIIGAAAAGGIFGAWRGSTVGGVSATAVFTLMAMIKRHCMDQGLSILPAHRQPPIYGGLRSAHRDWTLTKERPRNWTTAE